MRQATDQYAEVGRVLGKIAQVLRVRKIMT